VLLIGPGKVDADARSNSIKLIYAGIPLLSPKINLHTSTQRVKFEQKRCGLSNMNAFLRCFCMCWPETLHSSVKVIFFKETELIVKRFISCLGLCSMRLSQRQKSLNIKINQWIPSNFPQAAIFVVLVECITQKFSLSLSCFLLCLTSITSSFEQLQEGWLVVYEVC
jgi:hypothetical protein